jgi:hypothetical protein
MDLFRMLMRDRLTKQLIEFWIFIDVLSKLGLLDRVVPVYSAAEYLLASAGMFGRVKPSLENSNVGFLLTDPDQPLEPGKDLLASVKDFHGIVSTDAFNGTKSFLTVGGFVARILVPEELSDGEDCVPSALGFNLLTMRHTRLLLTNLIKIRIYNFNITVPSPEAYMMYRMGEWQDLYYLPRGIADPCTDLWPSLDKSRMVELSETLDDEQYDNLCKYLEQFNVNFKPVPRPRRKPEEDEGC